MTARWVFLLLGSCSLTWPAAACVMADEQRLALFKAWDTNHDGGLTEAEYVTGESARLQAANHAMSEAALPARYRSILRPGTAWLSPRDLAPLSFTRC